MGVGDSRVQFLIRLPHRSCVDLTPLSLEGQCTLVVNAKNFNTLLRKLTTYFISTRVKFIEIAPKIFGEDPLRGIVIPYVLYKFSKDFDKWKLNYDAPFFESSSQVRKFETAKSSALKHNQSRAAVKHVDDKITAWDIAELHQRNSSQFNNDSKTGNTKSDASKRKISISESQSPLHNQANKEDGATSVPICNGLLAEADIFRLNNLLMTHLEVKDRKYMITVHKDAFLGR